MLKYKVSSSAEETPEASTSHSSERTPQRFPIKATLFNTARDLHKKYQKGIKNSPQERNVMASGLSEILDLTNNDLELFSEQDWSRITAHFTKRYEIKTAPLSKNITKKWEYVVAKCNQTGNIISGRKYLDKLCGSDKVSDEDYKVYNFLEISITIQESNRGQ
jgi:hypothetical protein